MERSKVCRLTSRRRATQQEPMTTESAEPDVLFHIGFHKTGTTWLQRHVFTPQLDFRQVMNHGEVRRFVTGPNRLVFDPQPARRHIEQENRSNESAATQQRVISSELLCGNPFSGNRECADFAHRIREIGVPTRVLITIREQLSMITATYGQYVKRGGTLDIRQFLESAPIGFESFDPDVFCYDRVINLYRQLFGPARVCVIPREAMHTRRLDELNRLRSFCDLAPLTQLAPTLDIRVNESGPEGGLEINRRLNRLRRSSATPNPIVNLGRAASSLSKVGDDFVRRTGWPRQDSDRSVSAHVRSRFSGHFRESNGRLQELLDGQYDLSDLGYHF